MLFSSDGTEANYTNWKTDHPGNNAFVAMDLQTGSWETGAQEDQHYVMCMKSRSTSMKTTERHIYSGLLLYILLVLFSY